MDRIARDRLEKALARQAAVALLGARQVGKTTLALDLLARQGGTYLDLEDPRDRAKLSDPLLFLEAHLDRLVVLDEVHRMPELFPVLRGLIDRARREGRGLGRFLMLGSASVDLLDRSGESLAGRIAYVEMGPFRPEEVLPEDAERLWQRGGFPSSFLAPDEEASFAWRWDFLRTYLERDVAFFAPRIPTETIRRLWTMLAHRQGSLLNLSDLARNLGLTSVTVGRYVDLLVDLLLVRRLPPFSANLGKRLTKAPKLYIRDSGLVHALLGIADGEALMHHPIVGVSWEGHVVEAIANALPPPVVASHYRTQAGSEADLVLEFGPERRWVVEVKRTVAPRLGRGLHEAIATLQPERAFVVTAGRDRFPLTEGVEAIGLREFLDVLSSERSRSASAGGS